MGTMLETGKILLQVGVGGETSQIQQIFQAFILGIVQGITEFLPISSTAHLLIFTKVVGWKELGAKDLWMRFSLAV